MAKFCKNCGSELNENQDICLKCGVRVNKDKNLTVNNEDKASTTALTLGLISIIAWLIPLFGYPVTICGIVYSSKGLKSQSGKGKATAGLVLSIIFLIVTLINSIAGVINALN